MEVNQWKDKSVLSGASYDLNGDFRVHQVLRNLVIQRPDVSQKVALFRDEIRLTFADLEERSDRLACQLSARIQHESKPNDKEWVVAVCFHPSEQLIVALLAIFKIGAAYLPIDPLFPAHRVAHILNDAKPMMLLTSHSSLLQEAGFDVLIGDNLPVICYNQDQASQHLVEYLPVRNQNLAVVLYTSGSTGTPKGVRLTHGNIYHRLSWQWKTFPYRSSEVACFKTALTFVDSIAEIWAPLLMAVPVVIIQKHVTRNPELLVATLETCGVTRMVLVPSLLSSILMYIGTYNGNGCAKKRTDLLNQLRLWVCSGEVLTAKLLLQFYDHFGDGYQVCNFYGSTEVTGDVTYISFNCREQVVSSLVDNRVPLGSAIDNCAVYVVNAANEPVEAGEMGQVYVAGAHVADGYINRREMASFVANVVEDRKGYEIMYRTGDYGRIVNGLLYYEGRADSQIKVRGHRIDLTEINAVLNQLDQVSKGVVLCYKPGEAEQEIVAFVVLSNSTCCSTIHQNLKDKLISYAMPRVVQVDDIPLLVNGKIDRQLLLKGYANEIKSKLHVNKRWNQNELNKLDAEERRLASALFKTTLSVLGGSLHKMLSLGDNYFDVGGNSLNAVIVVTKLRDQGFHLDLHDFLAAENFQNIVVKMKAHQSCSIVDGTKHGFHFKVEMLNESVKDQVVRIICECFSQKGDLELLTGVTYEDYLVLVPALWDPIMAANLSFTVKDETGRVVAVGLHCDASEVPALNPRVKRLAYVFEVLEFVKAPVREALLADKSKRHVLQNFLVATDGTLSPAENVALVQLVEEQTLLLAKTRGYKCILTSNSSPLTQQICNDVLDYKILTEYQVNRFIAADGTRPFILAPETQYISVSVKYI